MPAGVACGVFFLMPKACSPRNSARRAASCSIPWRSCAIVITRAASPPAPLDQPNNPNKSDQPDKVLWAANIKAKLQGRGPAWQLLPTVIVVLGEDSFTGFDRATGKTLYTTPSGNFTDSPASARYQLNENPPSLYLIDDRALREQLRRDRPNSHPPATLARFDLLSGKFLWKTTIITPAGLKLRPMGLDPRG